MPIIANAKKALRQSKNRNARNSVVRAHIRSAQKKNVKLATKETLTQLFSRVDKAVKKHIIHKNKAARIKSQASKLISLDKPVAPKKTKSRKTTSDN